MEKRPALWSLAVFAALLSVPVAGAHHAQPLPGGAGHAVFDHLGGNEWWVEVRITGSVDLSRWVPSVRDEGGAWLTMERPSWATHQGHFVKSFHIEPGHRVQFRIQSGTQVLDSCWFTHPAGVEECAPPGAKDVTFAHKGGNEWWVETRLGGADAAGVLRVEAMDTAGPWTPLQPKPWGNWAASFRIEPGHQVRFQAVWSDGAKKESCWFTHPAGASQCATPAAFDAAFAGVKGNEWWVEAKVTANRPLAGVDARVDCAGAWTPMTLRSWGAWAASFQIPSGSKVDLRARATDGSTDQSAGYVWPSAAATSACPSTPTERFQGPAASNPIWTDFQLDAHGSGGGQVSSVAIDDNVGTITYRDRTWPVSAYVRTPWPTYGDLILYQFIAVQPDNLMVFWLYCRSGEMTHVWYEGAVEPAMSNTVVGGSCTETRASTSTPIALPASDFTLTRRVTNWQITGPHLSYDGSGWGSIQVGGRPMQWWPFQEVDCTQCEADGFYELHSLVRDPADGTVGFGILYFHPDNPGWVTLQYGLEWAPAARMPDGGYASTWTRS